MAQPRRPDLCATVLSLTPLRAATLPAHLGRAAHALFLRLIDAADPALAARLHDDAPVKPFTCGNLWRAAEEDRRPARSRAARDAEGRLVRVIDAVPGETWRLRYTALTADLSAAWLERVVPALPAQVELDGAPFRVQGAAVRAAEHPAAGEASYDDLAAPHLLGKAPAHARWRFHFQSPTSFPSAGMPVPLPLPDLLFGSLLARGNAWAPVALSPEVRRFAAECVAVSQYRLQSRTVPGKGRAVERGAVGQCTYAALNRDRYWCATLSGLAAFAAYGGAGYGTTRGMGACRWDQPA